MAMNKRLLEFTQAGSTDRALRRLAKSSPSAFTKVVEMRDTYRDLYELKTDDFDRVTVIALKSLVKEGICKTHKF